MHIRLLKDKTDLTVKLRTHMTISNELELLMIKRDDLIKKL